MRKFKIICPICNVLMSPFKKGIYDTRFGVEGLFDFYLCNSCDLVQIGHISDYNVPPGLYETYYNYGGQRHNRRYDRIKLKFFRSVFYKFWMKLDGDICFHSRKGHGKLLDVGCNEGAGTILYKDNGYDVEGLEINFRAAEIARNKGLMVSSGDIDTYDTQKLYDIVVLSNILEHTSMPGNVLKQAYRLLKPAGELWISTPNLNSIFRSVFGKYWINWHVPFHLNIFSLKALAIILNESGFRVKESKNISPSLWNAQSMIALLYSKMGKKTRQQRSVILVSALMVAIRFLFFPVLYVINFVERGDCINIVARKI